MSTPPLSTSFNERTPPININGPQQDKKEDEQLLAWKWKYKSRHFKQEATRLETVALTYRTHLTQFVTLVNNVKATIPRELMENDTNFRTTFDSLLVFQEVVSKDVLPSSVLLNAPTTTVDYTDYRKKSLDAKVKSKKEEDMTYQFRSISASFPVNPFSNLYSFTPLYKNLPRLKISKMSTAELGCIQGPEHENIDSVLGMGCAQSISTYPHIPGNPSRDGDPICDRYGVHIYENRVVAVIADGCNWGIRPRDAATSASMAFANYMKQHQEEIDDVKDAGPMLIKAFATAHEAILSGKEMYDAGTTTLLGGILMELDPNESPAIPYIFVCASVGDCKAFIKSGDRISEITVNNRGNIFDASDCGGRLGPHLEGGNPDLRNLTIFDVHCMKDDLIFLVSDGVHDNLDPQTLGIGPKALGLYEDNWKHVNPDIARKTKNTFMVQSLEEKLHGTREPEHVVMKLLEHCIHTTHESRKFMQDNVGKKLSNDYWKFPGKMDHTTVVCFKVGKVKPTMKPEFRLSTSNTNSNRLSVVGPASWKKNSLGDAILQRGASPEKHTLPRLGLIGKREKSMEHSNSSENLDKPDTPHSEPSSPKDDSNSI